MYKELKQKLENAGFESHYHDCQTCGVDSPTLSELIEACGEGFKGLLPPSQMANCWLAVQKIGRIEDMEGYEDGMWKYWTFSSGSTPEEAVANLWLALNEK